MPVDENLVGRSFPPAGPFEVTREAVDAFATSLGQPAGGQIPPTFPIVLAFDAMNAFLEAEEIDLHRIVHGEQRFAAERELVIGDVLTAVLTVASIRSLGGADVIGSVTEFRDSSGQLVCTGRATLVHSGGDR